MNFAHGSFFMLGALLSAHWVTNWYPSWGESGGALYALAMLIGAGVAALAGLRWNWCCCAAYGVPELYQLVATFGLTLAMSDAMRWGFRPEEVFAPRFPGLKGSIELAGEFFPVWQLVTMALGPLVWLGLHALLTAHALQPAPARGHDGPHHARRARGRPRPLMLGAVVLGCALAGLGARCSAARARKPADGRERDRRNLCGGGHRWAGQHRWRVCCRAADRLDPCAGREPVSAGHAGAGVPDHGGGAGGATGAGRAAAGGGAAGNRSKFQCSPAPDGHQALFFLWSFSRSARWRGAVATTAARWRRTPWCC